MLLLLWDIDGTLLQRASVEHALALRRALGEVHGVDAVETPVEVAGRTDGAIARDLLLAHGVAPAAIDASFEAVARATCRAYESLCPPTLEDKVAPGIGDLLGSLASDARYRLALLTGNFEPVAHLKLARAGIGAYFERGQGAFGSDAEEREALPPIARTRAGGPWPRERTVIIGDTPRDIACARADGLRVIAVTTGYYDASALAEADVVAETADDVAAALRSLS